MVTKARPSQTYGEVDVNDYVLAVIDHPVDAAQAEDALRAADFEEDAIVALGGWGAPAREHVRRRRAAARQFEALLAAHASEALRSCVVEQVRQGHTVLAVYAPEPPAFERALDVLEAHHAHAV